MKNETKLNSVQRPNREDQFDDLNRSTLHRQVTVQSPQPNSPAKKPAVICINVIILHSSASNVLHQYFSDQNPQSVSDFYLPTTVKLGIKELLNKEQIGFKELFTYYQLFCTVP